MPTVLFQPFNNSLNAFKQEIDIVCPQPVRLERSDSSQELKRSRKMNGPKLALRLWSQNLRFFDRRSGRTVFGETCFMSVRVIVNPRMASHRANQEKSLNFA
jgi:hypothetical protein